MKFVEDSMFFSPPSFVVELDAGHTFFKPFAILVIGACQCSVLT